MNNLHGLFIKIHLLHYKHTVIILSNMHEATDSLIIFN